MDEHGMSEQQAWRFLQTNAMDRRLKVHEVSKLVIDDEVTP
jgi:AmiR/NasT family two-component response regulator